MTTSELLERITDEGEFERLAIGVLSCLYSDCKNLVHLGMNYLGKTTRGPIDAFTRVPDTNPAQYVGAAFTTISRDKLKQKWYAVPQSSKQPRGKKPELGDLTKAYRAADTMRDTEPACKFKIYLCTNRRLTETIQNEGYAIGVARSIDVVFIEQSILERVLDSPDGQPLREQFLGRPVTSISTGLLQGLARKSLSDYKAQSFSADYFVATDSWKLAADSFAAKPPVLSLVARSGAGKSVIAMSLLDKHVDEGGIGLWIPSDILKSALSLQEAITLTLRQLSPSLMEDAGHSTLSLAGPQHPLLFVLDDPNRTDQPGRTLTKILNCGKNLIPEPKNLAPRRNESSALVTLVVPIWESQFRNIENDLKDQKWLKVISIGLMRRHESIECLSNGLAAGDNSIPHAQLDLIAERLDDDPILLTIFSKRVHAQGKNANINTILDDVIGGFIRESLGRLASHKDVLSASYITALTQVTRKMLVKRRPRPEWREVGDWLGSDVAQRIEDIAKQGEVCRISSQGRRDVFEFRHDRIFEWQMSDTIADEFKRDEPDWAAIFDPYMAEMTGRAIAAVGASDDVLDLAVVQLPTSLVAALAFLRPATHGQTKFASERLSGLRRLKTSTRHSEMTRYPS